MLFSIKKLSNILFDMTPSPLSAGRFIDIDDGWKCEFGWFICECCHDGVCVAGVCILFKLIFAVFETKFEVG